MSGFTDSDTTRPSLIRTDGLDLGKLAAATATSTATSERIESSRRFWSSRARPIASTHREVLEVSFGSQRLVNYFAFKAGRFPLVLSMQYWNAHDKAWKDITYPRAAPKSIHKARQQSGKPVRMTIAESVPRRVNSARAAAHPQHFGKGHWARESWKITPVLTSRIRFLIVRNHRGHPPRDHHNHRVPYSVAIRDLQIGYRVTSPVDIPTIPPENQDWWASSRDILGSSVVYSTYEQPAGSAVDGDRSTYWRSDPQPFPFAVVNLFLDVRDDQGQAPVIDRFWVDPVTTGPICNVYYADALPEVSTAGESTAPPSTAKTRYGNPVLLRDGASNRAYGIVLDASTKTGIAVANTFQRMHYDQPWWAGLDLTTLTLPDDPLERPLVSLGSTQVRQVAGKIQVLTEAGETAEVDLDPLHRLNSAYRLVVAYHPADPASGRGPYIRLTYRLWGQDPVTVEQAVTALTNEQLPIGIGVGAEPGDATPAGIVVHGLVVKSESLETDDEDWFLSEGAEYVAEPANPSVDRGNTQNARLRMHPQFVQDTDQYGIVGGPGDQYGDMVWTPVTRDYTLRRGYMYVPPTKARYWKFEMTRLLPQVYENFLTIDREVLVFPPDVVDGHTQVAGRPTSISVPSGARTNGNVSEQVTYSDALAAAGGVSADPDATRVLVVRDPVQAAQIASQGWIWTYQPWHVGSVAPRFMGTQQHRYESLRIKHQTKVAYFAGIREVTPYRLDYTFEDDTTEYVEHLLDNEFVETVEGMEQFVDGGYQATGELGELVSKTLTSHRRVRGVQFATQETDAFQVMEDPDFLSEFFDDYWTPYADADVDRIGPSNVNVNRGWIANTYGEIETDYPTYEGMDGVLYGTLEGNDPKTGYAEGGMVSLPYTPSGAGKLTAIVKVSSTGQLNSPVIVEMISSDDIVLATASSRVQQGQATEVSVTYAPGTVEQRSGGTVHRRTWEDVEHYSAFASVSTGLVSVSAAPATVMGGGAVWDDSNDGTYATITYRTAGAVTTYAQATLPVTAAGASVDVVDLVVRAVANQPSGGTVKASVVQGTLEMFAAPAFPVSNSVENHSVSLTPSYPDARFDLAEALASGTAQIRVVQVHDPADVDVDTDVTVHQVNLQVHATAGSTYADLDGVPYGTLESYSDISTVVMYDPAVRVRVRQQGAFRDNFNVHRIGLYDSPIAWSFSNDGGAHWWQAVDVRNDPHAVLLFPDPLPEDAGAHGVGTSLKWKAETYRASATINALHIRPWYGNRSRTTPGAHGLASLGPNKSTYDTFPPLNAHPMWLSRFNPIEQKFTERYREPPVIDVQIPFVLGDALVVLSTRTVLNESLIIPSSRLLGYLLNESLIYQNG